MSLPAKSGVVSNSSKKSFRRITQVWRDGRWYGLFSSEIGETSSEFIKSLRDSSSSSSSYGAANFLRSSSSAGKSIQDNCAASFSNPRRLQRPNRWTSDDQGASSVNSVLALTSTPASTTWVLMTIVPCSPGCSNKCVTCCSRSGGRNRE